MTNTTSGSFIVSPITGVSSGNTLSFSDIQTCLNFAIVSGLTSINIDVTAGNYPNNINIPDNIKLAISGPGSGLCTLGNVYFTVTGNFTVNTGTAAAFINVSVNNITIMDGSPPAVAAILVLENCAVTGNITSTGTSNLTLYVTGVSAVSYALAGTVQSSVIVGNINLPHTSITSSDTLYTGWLTCAQIFAEGCQFTQSVNTVSNGLECHRCTLDGYLTSSNILLDNFSLYQVYKNNITISSTPTILVPPKTFTIVVDGSDLTLSLLQYFPATIVFTGALVSSEIRTITFPMGNWMIDTTQMTFAGNGSHQSKLTLTTGNNSISITTANLWQFSSNALGVFIK